MFRQIMTTNLLEDPQTHNRTISCTRIHAHIYMYCDTSCQMAWKYCQSVLGYDLQ